jgi:glycosyltransferase involved in cell wall biosynthesis
VRVAIVTEVFMPAVDGVVTRLRRTLEELQRAGDEVLVIAPEGGPPEYAGAPVVGLRTFSMPLYPDGDGYPPKRVSLPGPALAASLRSFRPDVIHAINPVLLAAGAVMFARRNRLALVASYHAHLPAYTHCYHLGMLEPAGWRYVRALHNRAGVNLATSHSTLDLLDRQGIQRLAHWPFGIDTERFHPRMRRDRRRTELSAGRDDRLVLLYVGRLAREKTVEHLLEAVRGRDDVVLAVVGDGPQRDRLARAFRGTPTTFLGFLQGDDLAHAYASADVLLQPSQTETLGLVTLEALASGLPVIAADSPAARELIGEGIEGLRFDPGRPGSLRRCLDRLLADPDLVAAMRVHARESVVDATWAHATATLRGHYRRAREHEACAGARLAAIGQVEVAARERG